MTVVYAHARGGISTRMRYSVARPKLGERSSRSRRHKCLQTGTPREVSSVGRAPARQAGGHWFEPSTAHSYKTRASGSYPILAGKIGNVLRTPLSQEEALARGPIRRTAALRGSRGRRRTRKPRFRKSAPFPTNFEKPATLSRVGGKGSGRRAADGISRRLVGDIPSIVLS